MTESIIDSKLKRLQALTSVQPRLQINAETFRQQNADLFRAKHVVRPASQTIAARLAAPSKAKPKSQLVTVGEAPDGFGKQVLWNQADAQLAVTIFLSAADPLGVMISGVKRTDTIELVSATGYASFSEDTENEGAGAIIGIIAAGAKVAATAFGAPEVAPLISAGAKFAESQFKEKKVKTKRRDAFGEDPGTGHKARQEGGVLISLPEARQIYYSGNSDHKERWIKEPGAPRDFAHKPDHVHGAFFLQPRSNNLHSASIDGDIIIYPWDHIFDDNFGYYRLNMILKRGNGKLVEIE